MTASNDPGPNRSERVGGACLCGAVRFEVAMPTLFCAHCHCTMCRKNHGVGYVTWIGVERSQLAVKSGADDLVRHASSDHGSRSFCRRCGSSLFCESSRHPDRVDIPLANLEGPIDREPQMHVYFSDRAAWVEVDDVLPRTGGDSGLEPLE